MLPTTSPQRRRWRLGWASDPALLPARMGAYRRQREGFNSLQGCPKNRGMPAAAISRNSRNFFVERLHGKAGRLEGFKEVPVIGWRHC